MKKSTIVSIIGGIILLGIGGLYFYLSQPAVLPSQTVQGTQEPSTNADQKTLSIVSAESKATYELNEVLRGVPTHVIGATSDIAGNIMIDLNSSEKIKIGEVKVNARTFKTDIDTRDQNVRKLVLKSDEPANEFIVFKTTNIAGMPAVVERGKDFPIAITGDITIAGVTKPVTFEGTVSISETNALAIHANTMLAYENFGLKIPDFSFLANVDKSVKLEISLIAR